MEKRDPLLSDNLETLNSLIQYLSYARDEIAEIDNFAVRTLDMTIASLHDKKYKIYHEGTLPNVGILQA